MAEVLRQDTIQEIASRQVTGDKLAQIALNSALSAAERGGFELTDGLEDELRTAFENQLHQLPLATHGLGCEENNAGRHGYLFPGYEIKEE